MRAMEIDDAANPLIWTAAGYVREQDMVLTVDWEIQTRLVEPPRWKFWLMGVGHSVMTGMVCIERRWLDGKIVKETRHVYQAEGVPAMGQIEEIA